MEIDVHNVHNTHNNHLFKFINDEDVPRDPSILYVDPPILLKIVVYNTTTFQPTPWYGRELLYAEGFAGCVCFFFYTRSVDSVIKDMQDTWQIESSKVSRLEEGKRGCFCSSDGSLSMTCEKILDQIQVVNLLEHFNRRALEMAKTIKSVDVLDEFFKEDLLGTPVTPVTPPNAPPNTPMTIPMTISATCATRETVHKPVHKLTCYKCDLPMIPVEKSDSFRCEVCSHGIHMCPLGDKPVFDSVHCYICHNSREI
jgi:hypothetical protein